MTTAALILVFAMLMKINLRVYALEKKMIRMELAIETRKGKSALDVARINMQERYALERNLP